MPIVNLTIPKPYAQQQAFLDQRKRYNAACWGRRAGKTSMSPQLMCETLLGRRNSGGGKLGWFWPNYKVVEPFWNYYVELFYKVTTDKDESDHYLKLKTGGVLEAWSFGVGGVMARSRDYDRAIIEECRENPNLKSRWEMEIRPTLIDHTGDAYFFSTPNGDDDFKTLFDLGDGGVDPEWNSNRMPTWDNPYLPRAERERVKYQAEVIQDPVARQEYGAEFVSTADAFVSPNWVDACAQPNDWWQPLDPYTPICVGIDVGLKNDCFAICGWGRDVITRKYKCAFSRIFHPEELSSGPGIVSFAKPKEYLRHVSRDYHILEFAYDPHQAQGMADDLRQEGLQQFVEYPQGTKRTLGDSLLYTLVRDALLEFKLHDSDHAEMAQHIKNANAKIEGEDKRRMVKRTDMLKIDAGISTSMALWSLQSYNV